ncbi:MAG: 16S rRNA (guanine(527)-N(7))-methyltransferase RsmG [bacterium]|nr:16S rRNA (guanine(527)-N(7))-methyltransferase RsmG [bacterium]
MSESEFISSLKELGLGITEEQINKFRVYASDLLSYNEHTNLTAIRNLDEVYLKHFYDSLTVYNVYKFTNESVLDIGTGAGFPGIVLKIMFPDIKLTLLDSNNKKTTFLKYVLGKLGIEANVINDRAEKYYLFGERYDVVVSRAVADMSILSELAIPFCKVGGAFIAMKGKSSEEIDNANYAIEFLGGKISEAEEFSLPKDAGERTLVKVEKVSDTPNGYPRVYDKIRKSPIAKTRKIK